MDLLIQLDKISLIKCFGTVINTVSEYWQGNNNLTKWQETTRIKK